TSPETNSLVPSGLTASTGSDALPPSVLAHSCSPGAADASLDETGSRLAGGEQDMQHQARHSVINVAPATLGPPRHVITLTGCRFLPRPRKPPTGWQPNDHPSTGRMTAGHGCHAMKPCGCVADSICDEVHSSPRALALCSMIVMRAGNSMSSV